jgi:hypothetical protein
VAVSGALVLLTTSLMTNGLGTDTSLHCCKISCEQHYCRSLNRRAIEWCHPIGRERGSVDEAGWRDVHRLSGAGCRHAPISQ